MNKKELQDRLIEIMTLICTDDEKEEALGLINQLKEHINDDIEYGSRIGTALDLIIFCDTKGYDSGNLTRLNNRVLLELEQAIRGVGGKTSQELVPLYEISERLKLRSKEFLRRSRIEIRSQLLDMRILIPERVSTLERARDKIRKLWETEEKDESFWEIDVVLQRSGAIRQISQLRRKRAQIQQLEEGIQLEKSALVEEIGEHYKNLIGQRKLLEDFMMIDSQVRRNAEYPLAELYEIREQIRQLEVELLNINFPQQVHQLRGDNAVACVSNSINSIPASVIEDSTVQTGVKEMQRFTNSID